MRRRELIVLVGTIGLWPFAARAQLPPRMKRVAMIHPAKLEADPTTAIVLEEMKRLGYAEGTNLIVDRYSAEGRYDRFPQIARDVVATGPDVIYLLSTRMVHAVQFETRTIPVVAWMTDPVAAGVASSLARPGGNVTGASTDGGAEMGAKYIQLLSEAVGKLSNVRLLGTPPIWEKNAVVKTMREAAEKMNIPFQLEPLQAPIDETGYRRAFDAMQRDHVDGVVISSEPEHSGANGLLLGRLAQEYRIPEISVYISSVESGALMCYAWNAKGVAPHVAAQIVDILNGGNPAEIPFYQETRWTLVINLKAAKELGLEIPAGLVARADRVIE
jgi:putative ABC transport system substrate-binding protein